MSTLRRGRRPGPSDSREALLGAARDVFAERGYDAATTREIAARAGVDAAMIRHHFGSKSVLFMESVRAPVDLADLLRDVVAGPVEDLAEGTLRTVLRLWDSPMSSAILAVVRTATQHEWGARLAKEFVLARGVRPVVNRVEPDPVLAETRSALVATQIGGLVLARYVLAMEPLASATHDEVVAAIAPTLQRYLTGPVAPMTGQDHG
ncbi:TetR family transcriptional regulator [Actinotalea sp. K2]|uniref:TetR/AcrR family transcriptional regulator n=1 Tax=Actinotalea sp. K2 TaxID=2939438 RepID=UPI002016C292|nr:TetR family transcriptional regulator [Actinotalea sp. K2]MCL3862903.1 TetR family transcriptional regulator [Actinotalea sp. K2]